MFFCPNWLCLCLHQDWLKYDLKESVKEAASGGDSEEADSSREDDPACVSEMIQSVLQQSSVCLRWPSTTHRNPNRTAAASKDWTQPRRNDRHLGKKSRTKSGLYWFCDDVNILDLTKYLISSVFSWKKSSGQLHYFPRMHLGAPLVNMGEASRCIELKWIYTNQLVRRTKDDWLEMLIIH